MDNIKLISASHIRNVLHFQSATYRLVRKRALLKRRQQQRRISLEKLRLELRLLSSQIVHWNRPKKFWTKPRASLFWEKEVAESDENFFKENFRVDRRTFNKLCIELKPLEKKSTPFRIPIPLEKRIAIALYSLGSSAEYRTIANLFGVGKSTVCYLLKQFCVEVWTILQPKYLNSYPLDRETIRESVEGFAQLGYPQCLGAIDGCHIEVRPRKEDAVDYFNYKGWYSTVLLALVDFRFLYINVGSPGRCNDSQIYEKSGLKTENQKPILKEMSAFISGVSVPVHIIGDSAFRFSNTLMKTSSAAEKNFNYCLSKCRRVVENPFGHLKARFRRVGKGVDSKIDNVNSIIKCVCVLHNFVNHHNDQINNHWMQQLQEQQQKTGRVQPENNATITDNDPNAEEIRKAITQHLYEPELDGAAADSSNVSVMRNWGVDDAAGGGWSSDEGSSNSSTNA